MANTLGDFDTSAVVYGKFVSVRADTGAPATLTSGALSVYKDNSTTESTTGVTFTGDFDSRTGFNHFAIDTSADGTFYSSGSFFDVVITTGTVNSVSAVGYCVGQFTIKKAAVLRPATAGRTLVVDASGLADANTVKLGPTGSGTAQTARDIGASVLLSTGTGTGQLDFTSGVVKANATQWLGGTIPAVNTTGVPLVDTKYLTGTLQTARDIGASVLLSAGTGTGQLDFTSGVVKANLVQILGTALTETAGFLAAGFKQFFNIASPTSTMNTITAVTTTTTATNLTNAPTNGDLTATMKASVTTAATASLATTTYTEPGQGAPGVTISLADKIGYIYKFLRNKVTQTSTTFSVYADDTTTVDQKATTSDDGTTFTRNEIASGP